MKVYLVKIYNGEMYEDYSTYIAKAFTTFRGASKWLLNREFKPYIDYDYGTKECDVKFEWYENNEYMARCEFAEIIEIEVESE